MTATNGADVQIDKGSFTRIHNAILEQLAYRDFTSREYACILYLLRMTYGFNRKDCQLSNGDFAKATRLDRGSIIKTLRQLVDRNVIHKNDGDPYHAAMWSFNKYFEQWDAQTSDETSTSDETTTSQNVTTSSDETSTISSDETSTTYISAKDSKEKKEKKIHTSRSPKEPTPNGVMFERLCFILFSHTNTKDGLTDKQRGLLNAETKRMQKIGATPDDLAEWYKIEWRNNWPGNQGQHPTVGQVISGMTAWMERSNGKCSELDDSVTVPAPNGKVTGFDVSQLLGGA